MKSDSEIREDVIRELQWDPQITDPEAIGVVYSADARWLFRAPSKFDSIFSRL